ncbi:MAG: hypothetical protein ACI9KE_003109 [Polyangiales bacterium]|jgi:hypothetical protein
MAGIIEECEPFDGDLGTAVIHDDRSFMDSRAHRRVRRRALGELGRPGRACAPNVPTALRPCEGIADDGLLAV